MATRALTSLRAVLELPAAILDALTAHAYDEYPYEGCGLLAGPPTSGPGAGLGGPATHCAARYYPCRNAAKSARVYTIDPLDHLRAERDAEENGWEIIGVVHSHTHSEPYPSPTDVAQAPVPAWHYVIVGLKRESPEVRTFRIADGGVTEAPIRVV